MSHIEPCAEIAIFRLKHGILYDTIPVFWRLGTIRAEVTMKKSELVCQSAAETLSSSEARIKAKTVLIIDYDDTLFTRDLTVYNDPSYEGDAPLYLIGGDTTKEQLGRLRAGGVVICVATNKSKDGAEEAVEAIYNESMADLFTFVAYEYSKDNKKKLLSACKTRFIHPEGDDVQYYFVDDNHENVHTAISLGISGTSIQTNPQLQRAKNAEFLNGYLSALIDELDLEIEGETLPGPSSISAAPKNQLQKKSEIFNSLHPQSRLFLEWLFSSIHINFLAAYLLTKKMAEERKSPRNSQNNIFMKIFRMTFGFDGLDPVSDEVIAASGEKRITQGYSLIFLLTSFLGLSNRPAGFDRDGNPILTWSQFFFNMLGGWTLTLKTWTWIEILELPFKFFVVLPIKLLRVFFNIPLNTLKLFTESLMGLINGFLTVLIFVPVTLLEILVNSRFNRLFKLILGIMLATISLSLIVVQYTTLWAVRIGLALTSPEKSARYAFALGRSLKIDWFGDTAETVISYVAGILGVFVSVALTAALWTILLPIFISAITTFIPGIIPALLWVSHLSWISASIAWASHLPIVMSVITAVSSVFAPIGAFLGSLLGSLITGLAGLMGVQVTAMTMLVGTALGFSAAIIGTSGSWLIDQFCIYWINWHKHGQSIDIGKTPDGEDVPLLVQEQNEEGDNVVELEPQNQAGQHVQKDNTGPAAEKSDNGAQGAPEHSSVVLNLEAALLASKTDAERREIYAKSYEVRFNDKTPPAGQDALRKEVKKQDKGNGFSVDLN